MFAHIQLYLLALSRCSSPEKKTHFARWKSHNAVRSLRSVSAVALGNGKVSGEETDSFCELQFAVKRTERVANLRALLEASDL